MSKQLRLDVAQLTDVGKRRPHNEDNMAYVIPKDPQVMAKKGALFLVADGMGGHAAGEVASEIAVDTISTVYYQDESDDILVSLVRSIKRANMLIHQRAAENMSRSGMGTTCVAAVMRGDTACVANVGDSRAYLVRKGQGKQVSQDHSWVEEQVRAGLLTHEQARSHAQRNVITRSLGTQPDVEVDIFTEKLGDGDTLLLCSDGLSGMVGDEELHVIVDQFVPQESVYRLVERANDNGGADNITAIVIHVVEAGEESPPMRYPVHVGVRESSDETTTILGRVPSAPLGIPSRLGSLSSGISRQGIAAPSFQPAASLGGAVAGTIVPRRKQSRQFYPVVVLLVLVALVVLVGGGYFAWIRLLAPVDVDAYLDQTNVLVGHAKAELTQDPAAALKDLSDAQAKLRVVQTGSLSDAQQKRFNSLRDDLTPTVQNAITNYNQQEKIYTLPCTTTTNAAVNTGSTNTQAGNIALVQDDKDRQLYTLGDDHNLYRIDSQQHSLVDLSKASGDAKYIAIAATKQHLLALSTLSGKGNGQATTYSLTVLTPGTDGKLGNPQLSSLDSYIKDGQEPKLIAAWENDVYVVLTSPNAQNQAVILDFPLGLDSKLSKPRQKIISVSSNPASIVAFPKNQLFLQYSDGSILSLQFNGGQAASSVVVQHPIAAPLDTSAKDFTFKVNVPKPGSGQPSTFLSLPLPSTPRTTFMVSSMIDNVPHLFIVDGMYHRILDLQEVQVPTNATPTTAATQTAIDTSGVASSPPVTMTLDQQYASNSLLDLVKGVAVDPQTSTALYLLSSRDGAPPASLIMVDTSQKNGCDAPR